MLNAADDAFIDRADIVEYIGLPSADAIYGILRSCVLELMRTGLVERVDVPSATAAKAPPPADVLAAHAELRRAVAVGIHLEALAARCQGMSGRSLRRLPVLAHARYIGFGLQPERVPEDVSAAETGSRQARASPVELWLDAMDRVVAGHELSQQARTRAVKKEEV